MHEPEIFAKNNKGSLNGTASALDKIGHLIQWKADHSDTVLDIGCGPGNVLMDVVLPRFKGKYKQVYAIDLSEKMIEFANNKYSGVDSNVKFLKLDIVENADELLRECGHVDHVVSSFVIHWIPDQDTALKNIFKVLKPGGDFFTVHCRDSTLFNFYEFMDKNEKWNEYFDNLKAFVPASHTAKQPEQDLRNHLAQCGFSDVFVDFIPYEIKMDNGEAMKVLFSSGLAQIHSIPEDRRREYVDDVFEYGIEHKLLTVHPSGEVSMPFNLFIAYGRKAE